MQADKVDSTFGQNSATAISLIVCITVRKIINAMLGATLVVTAACSGKSTSATAAANGAPQITSTIPADNDQCAVNNSAITVIFSNDMNPASVAASFHLNDNNAAPVHGSMTYAGRVATFSPDVPLVADSSYTAGIDDIVEDAQGNRLSAPYTWTFNTIPGAVTPGDYIVCWNPVNDTRLTQYQLYWDNKLPIDTVSPVGQMTVTAHSYQIAPALLGKSGNTIYMAVSAQSNAAGAASALSDPIMIVIE